MRHVVARLVLLPAGIAIYGADSADRKIPLRVWNDDSPPQYAVNKLMMRPGYRHEFETLPLRSSNDITAVS